MKIKNFQSPHFVVDIKSGDFTYMKIKDFQCPRKLWIQNSGGILHNGRVL